MKNRNRPKPMIGPRLARVIDELQDVSEHMLDNREPWVDAIEVMGEINAVNAILRNMIARGV